METYEEFQNLSDLDDFSPRTYVFETWKNVQISVPENRIFGMNLTYTEIEKSSDK